MNTWLEQLKGVLNIFRERDLMIVKFNGDRAWNHCLVRYFKKRISMGHSPCLKQKIDAIY